MKELYEEDNDTEEDDDEEGGEGKKTYVKEQIGDLISGKIKLSEVEGGFTKLVE